MSSSETTNKSVSVNNSISLTPNNQANDVFRDKTQKHFDTFKHSIFQKLNYINHAQSQGNNKTEDEREDVIDEATLLHYIVRPDTLNKKIINNNLYLNDEVQSLKKKLNDMIIMNKILDDQNKKLSDEFTAMKLEQHFLKDWFLFFFLIYINEENIECYVFI